MRHFIHTLLCMVLLSTFLATPFSAHAQTGGYTFTGRRGASYTATWNETTYEVEITTPNNTFPWDFISFVGPMGAIALNGLPNIGNTFAFSENSSIAGAMPGDILRVKGHDAWVLSHLSKIGMVIDDGEEIQRGWFSQGNISSYLLEPGSVGYRVNLLGRHATVQLTLLTIDADDFVAVIAITLDDPTDARLVFATDLEPAISYTYGVEYHNTADTQLAYDGVQEAIQGTAQMNSGDELAYWARTHQHIQAFVYASEPLLGWSANNLPLNDYLQADTLDATIAGGYNDGRVALTTQAQSTQYFYIGTTVLTEALRTNPVTAWEALCDERLNTLSQLPIMEADALPGITLTSMLANLLNSYLFNPDGQVYAADRLFIYTPDSLLPLISYPALLPPAWQATYRALLEELAAQVYPSPPVVGTDMYWWKLDLGGPSPLPAWYGGNISDLLIYLPDNGIYNRRQFSDVHSDTEYLLGLRAYYQVTGDLPFIQSQAATINTSITALQQFNTVYDQEFTPDGNLYPHIMMSVADLSTLDGVYPSESAATIYAYEAAADLLDALGDHAAATDLRVNYVVPMRAAFDSTFWDVAETFYMPYADQRNGDGKTNGQQYQDKWSNNLLFSLRGNIGETHKAEVLNTYTTPDVFFEPGGDVHWMSTDSEHFMDHGGYGISPAYNNGYIMEGGFFSMLPALAPIGYYQLGDTTHGDQYANLFLDSWLQMGPYETMMEYNGQIPGRMLESSMYIEGTAMPMWLISTALGIQVQGTQVTFQPRLSGAFQVRNLYLGVNGQHALLDYYRSDDGCETFEIRQNTGLTIISANFETLTWQGDANEDWNTPANWGGTLPTCNTHVIIPSGNNVTLSADGHAQDLSIQAGALLDMGTYTLSANGTVTNLGTLQQTAQVDATCTTGDGCALGFIYTHDGLLTRHFGVYLRPTGSNPTLGAVTAAIRGGQPCGQSGNLRNTVHRCFEITPTNPQPVDLTLYYSNGEANANAMPQVWHYLGSGQWEQQTFGGRGSQGNWQWVRALNVNAFSPFALSDGQPTALNLTRLQAASTTNHATLHILLLIGLSVSGLYLARRRLPCISGR